MPADNLEIFKKVIFSLPSFRKSLTLSFLSGIFYSTVIFFFFEDIIFDVNGFVFVPLLALGLFVFPGIVSSELYSFLLPGYPRKWGYFLSLVNQLIIFLFAVLITLSENFYTAWQIIWLALTTLFINNFFILVLSTGPDYLKRISLLSVVQPLMILTGFHLLLGRFLQIGFLAYVSNFLVILAAGIVLVLSIYLTEFLVGSNVSNISILDLATALLQNRQEKLDLGRKVRPDVQTLKIKNQSGEKTFLAPWLHPGPLEGFGGGRITDKIVKKLNDKQNQGFFLHVPSCHQMDPSDPKDGEKVLKAISNPKRESQASRLFKKQYENATFYGRKIGNQKIVFLEIENFDDYDSAVFQEVIGKEDAMVIDLHNQSKDAHLGEMRYGTRAADRARENLRDFLQELEKLSVSNYNAGFSMHFGTKPVMALVEKSDDQKTLLFGIEGNDASQTLLELREKYQREFDEVLLFTTDTHASVHQMAGKISVDKSEVASTVEEAEKDLSSAEIGFTSREAEQMKFLKDDYFGLIYTINILVRLIPIMLVALYLALIIWLL